MGVPNKVYIYDSVQYDSAICNNVTEAFPFFHLYVCEAVIYDFLFLWGIHLTRHRGRIPLVIYSFSE